jgi:hypothetical protein
VVLRIAGAAGLLAIAPGLAACGGGEHCRAGSRPPALVERAARHAAELLHDSSARTGKYVRTTRQSATSLVGGDVNAPDRPVYLVVLSGHFGGGRFLPGRLADFTVDVHTGRVLDIGTSNLLPSLSPLGRAHHFRLADCRRPAR